MARYELELTLEETGRVEAWIEIEAGNYAEAQDIAKEKLAETREAYNLPFQILHLIEVV